MVNVIYDKRSWDVIVRNAICPHLFYPDSRHACRLRELENMDDCECVMERCPMKINEIEILKDALMYIACLGHEGICPGECDAPYVAGRALIDYNGDENELD